MFKEIVAEKLRIVVFKVGSELYGLDISQVNEIIKLQDITEIPDTKEFIKGVINLRGKIIPVVSMKKRMRIAESGYERKARIIIIRQEDYEVGLIADEVHKVIQTAPEQLEAAMEEMGGKGESFFETIYKSENGIVGILSLRLLLGMEEAA